MPTVESVEFLEWDSEFFSMRIGRLKGSRIDEASLAEIDHWSKENRIDCLYFLTDPADTLSIRLAEDAGFHLTDVRVTLDLKITPKEQVWRSSSPLIKLSTPDDISPLRTIAAANHRDSRFYHDGGFPVERCDDLYATWIEKSCNGYADAVLVADKGSGAVGYFTCHLKEGNSGQIGLVGVSSCCQGEGLGRLLISEALKWFAANGVKLVDVVTQGINVGAQRLYQKSGFMTSSIELWYHRWDRDQSARNIRSLTDAITH